MAAWMHHTVLGFGICGLLGSWVLLLRPVNPATCNPPGNPPTFLFASAAAHSEAVAYVLTLGLRV